MGVSEMLLCPYCYLEHVMEGVFTGFVVTRPVLKQRKLAQNICIF